MVITYLVEETSVITHNHQTFELEYYLTEEISKSYRRPLYGIQVKKIFEGKEELESTGAISYSKELVTQMIRDLCRNTVTPMTLVEVVDEEMTICEEMA